MCLFTTRERDACLAKNFIAFVANNMGHDLCQGTTIVAGANGVYDVFTRKYGNCLCQSITVVVGVKGDMVFSNAFQSMWICILLLLFLLNASYSIATTLHHRGNLQSSFHPSDINGTKVSGKYQGKIAFLFLSRKELFHDEI